ncbi:hypothetical protein D3C86_1967650 [compost metagenome]
MCQSGVHLIGHQPNAARLDLDVAGDELDPNRRQFEGFSIGRRRKAQQVAAECAFSLQAGDEQRVAAVRRLIELGPGLGVGRLLRIPGRA